MKLEDLDSPMTPHEKRASLSLAGIYLVRMLGLFLILPVFSLYARELDDATPALIGLAISAYGLTQAVLQIPFGLISDRMGRKPMIAFGMILFAAGSVVAALSDSIYGIIAGRAMQGAGAVAGVIMALAADLTREEHRTKAMALIGISIGFSFALSMVLGPLLSAWLGMSGLFWLIAALAILGIVILYGLVPAPQQHRFHRDTQAQPSRIRDTLSSELLRLNFGIFSLHATLTALFVALPLVLRDRLALETAEHWKLYLPVFAGALVTMVPFVILAEKKRRMREVFLAAIGLIVISTGLLPWLQSSLWTVSILVYIFFTAFNLLEATLPSLVSKIAPADLKGTAMSIYSTSQFLGAFAGGAGAGWLQGEFGLNAVFCYASAIALLWLLVARSMQPPRHLSSLMLNLGSLSAMTADHIRHDLENLPGVAEAVVVAEEGIAYLKVDKQLLDKAQLIALVNQHTSPTHLSS